MQGEREKLTKTLALAYPGQADSEHTYKFNVKVMIQNGGWGVRASEALTERTAARFPIAGAASHTPHTLHTDDLLGLLWRGGPRAEEDGRCAARDLRRMRT